MKKILAILASFGLTASTSVMVVSCGPTTSPVLNQIKAVGTSVEVNLVETRFSQKLTANDQEKVFQTINQQLQLANDQANVNNQTFTVDLSKVTPELKHIPVVVRETEPENGLPGLIGGKVKVNLSLTPIFGVREKANGGNLAYQLTQDTNEGDILSEADQNLLGQKILELLKWNNQDKNLNDPKKTFTFNVSNVTFEKDPINPITVPITVQQTDPTNHLIGVLKGTIDVTLKLLAKS